MVSILQQNDLLLGFILGQTMRLTQPPDLAAIIIGIVILAVSLVISTLFVRDLGQATVEDTAKVLWAIILYIMPVLSWIAYYFVVKK